MKIVFSVLILLALDIVIFYATCRVTKRYIQEQRIISDNLETLITSVETTKLGSYCVAVKDGDKTYFEEYLGSVDEDLINMAIVTRSSKGQVIALKGLCENIIVKVQMKREYDKLTDQKVKEIHNEGKLTSFDMVDLWQQNNVCVPSDDNRCSFFDNNCDSCLLEYASHKLEYDVRDVQTTIAAKEKTLIKR